MASDYNSAPLGLSRKKDIRECLKRETPADTRPRPASSPPRSRPTPSWLPDMSASNRYNAACAAALATSEIGPDKRPPDEQQNARLRTQALHWLDADLADWARLSFKGTLQAISAIRDSMRMTDPKRRAQLWEAMFDVIAYDRVGDCPGRVEPRCKKRRPKTYRMLTIPREEARERLDSFRSTSTQLAEKLYSTRCTSLVAAMPRWERARNNFPICHCSKVVGTLRVP